MRYKFKVTEDGKEEIEKEVMVDKYPIKYYITVKAPGYEPQNNCP